MIQFPQSPRNARWFSNGSGQVRVRCVRTLLQSLVRKKPNAGGISKGAMLAQGGRALLAVLLLLWHAEAFLGTQDWCKYACLNLV